MKPSPRILAVVPSTILLLALLAPAQFFSKPKVPVRINHPPNKGVSLTGKKVAFADATGLACASQVNDDIQQDFDARGVHLIERANLNGMLAEHNLQISGEIDPATAVRIGKLLGPAMMVFVNITRCRTEQQALHRTDFLNHLVLISQTQAFVDGTVRVVDLTTGADIGITRLQVSLPRENDSTQGQPEFPAGPEVMDAAMQKAAATTVNDYFPWTETAMVDFLDNNDCGLKLAYKLLKAGDMPGALEQSRQNVAACQSDSNSGHRANALYNLGVAQMLSAQYPAALDTLKQALTLHSDKRIEQAIAQCRSAQANALALHRNQAAQAAVVAAAAQQAAVQAQTVANNTLTNAGVVKLVKGGLGDDVILGMIAGGPTKFTLTTDSILALKQAGVSDKVIAAMLAKH